VSLIARAFGGQGGFGQGKRALNWQQNRSITGCMKKIALFASLAGLLLIAAAPKPTSPDEIKTAKPALWKVADKDTTVYLFGTIHYLPKGLKWRTAKFDKAVDQSAELVLETADLDEPEKIGAMFVAAATNSSPPPISARIPADRMDKLLNLAKAAEMPRANLDRLETWAIAIGLATSAIKQAGLEANAGAESVLQSAFKAARKPVSGLETSQQQLSFFDGLPEAAQRVFLVSLIDESADLKTEAADMLWSWAKGDQKAISLSFDDELKLSPELMETLLRKRNANWSAWIAQRLEKPGTIMIAVGAGHLAGADSVQMMLAQRGIKARRIQ
jgi:uncharacterized protein YbaP (TraB family)